MKLIIQVFSYFMKDNIGNMFNNDLIFLFSANLLFVISVGCEKVESFDQKFIEDVEAVGGRVFIYDSENVADWNVPNSFKGHARGFELHLVDLSGPKAFSIPETVTYFSWWESILPDNAFDNLDHTSWLQEVNLSNTNISHKQIKQLSKLSRLNLIHLSGCSVDDGSLRTLMNSDSLNNLILFDTLVTEEGVKEFLNENSDAEIVWSSIESPEIIQASQVLYQNSVHFYSAGRTYYKQLERVKPSSPIFRFSDFKKIENETVVNAIHILSKYRTLEIIASSEEKQGTFLGTHL